MKELVKPQILEEQFQNIEGYCELQVCRPLTYICSGQAGCPGHVGVSVDKEDDILY